MSEPSGASVSSGSGGVVTGISWEQFEIAMARVLAELPARTFMIVFVRMREEYFVQCTYDDGRPLTTEAVGDDYLPAPLRIGADGANTLRALGWHAPRDTPGNWWVDIAWPGRTADFASAASRMVVALRDVYGANEPGDLMYTAWRDPAPLRDDDPDSRAADRDPGADEVAYDRLGIEFVPREAR